MLAFGLLSEGGEGPDTTLLWLLIVALVFFFLMVIVGWLVSRNNKPETQNETHDHHETFAMKNLIFVLLIFAVLALTACGGGEVAATPEAIPAEFAGKTNPLGADSATAGAQVYKTYCLACHGEQGHGDGPAGVGLSPKPKNLPELAATVGDDYLFWRIAKGKPGTSMVGWQGTLDDEKIWQVITFIHSLK